jgi:hypothetical protein
MTKDARAIASGCNLDKILPSLKLLVGEDNDNGNGPSSSHELLAGEDNDNGTRPS